VRSRLCSWAAHQRSSSTLVRIVCIWSGELERGEAGLYRIRSGPLQPKPCATGRIPRAGTSGPFWGRLYLFWHGGQPLTVIHEVFSPHLAEYLLPGKSDSVT
jgi:p-hydroxybenzoic acid synthase